MKSRMNLKLCRVKSKVGRQVLEKHFIHSKGLSSYLTHKTQGNKSAFE